jgi:3'(2'), 5'-bisphosphate nucleotidase
MLRGPTAKVAGARATEGIVFSSLGLHEVSWKIYRNVGFCCAPRESPRQGNVVASEYCRLADGLLSSVLSAGRVQMAHFKTGVSVQTKPDQSPVTIADQQSEAILLEGLARVAPGIPVVAEEAVTAGNTPPILSTFFLVDPLDGTKGFINGRTEFTINVGLIEAGRPSFGLIYAPALGDLYVTLGPDAVASGQVDPFAAVGRLADCALQPVHTRIADPQALKALTSHAHLNHATSQFLDGYNVIERLAVASSLKFGLLAKGWADVYPRVGPTSEWDTAAGHALLVAAGGIVTRLDGAALTYGNHERGFANPNFVAWGRTPRPRQRNV